MPFSIINDINAGREPKNPEKFSPWLTARFFSMFPDTLYYAQLLNLNYELDPKLQLQFLQSTVRPSRRWNKWLKRSKEDKYHEAVKKHYGFSDRKTREALVILSKEQISYIVKLHEHET